MNEWDGAPPEHIRPMLAESADPFDSEKHVFEVKWDGIRCIAHLNKKTRLESRNLNDLGGRYPELLDIQRAVDCRQAIVDGEIVLMGASGPDFYRLLRRDRLPGAESIRRAAMNSPVVLVVFDLLYLNGHSLMKRPLSERQHFLRDIVQPNERILVTQGVIGVGQAYFETASARGLEGIMAKRLDSPYLPGRRTRDWLKIKRLCEADYVIGGYTPRGADDLGALVLGEWPQSEWRPETDRPVANGLLFAGHVGTGFDTAERRGLIRRLRPLETTVCPFKQVPHPVAKASRWVRPTLVCSVRFLERTPDGVLRHSTFLGMRDDKPASEVIVSTDRTEEQPCP